MKKSRGIVGMFKKSVNQLKGQLIGLAAGMGLKAMVGTFVDTGDALHKMSIRTGISVERLSQLTHAASQSGTNIDQLSQAIFRMNRRVGNAATGTGPAVRALKVLGIEAKALGKLDTEAQFMKLVDALNAVEDSSLRSQMGFEVFGDNWRQIKPLIDQGTEGIKKLNKEANLLGLTVSKDTADKAAALGDTFGKLGSVFMTLAVDVGAALAPMLTEIAELFMHLAPILKSVIIPILTRVGNIVAFVIDKVNWLLAQFNKMIKFAQNIPGVKGFMSFFELGFLNDLQADTTFSDMTKKAGDVSIGGIDEIGSQLEDVKEVEEAQLGKLENIEQSVAQLPPVMEQGSAQTLGAITKFLKADRSREVVKELKDLNGTQDDQLFELKKKTKLRKAFVLRPL